MMILWGEQTFFPFCRWRSWGFKRCSPVLLWQSWPPNPNLFHSSVDTGMHPNLAMREKILTASSNLSEHMCIVSYILFIPKPHTLKKNKSMPLQGTRDQAECFSASFFHVQLGSPWRYVPVRAEPGNQWNPVQAQSIFSPVLYPFLQLSSPEDKEYMQRPLKDGKLFWGLSSHDLSL